MIISLTWVVARLPRSWRVDSVGCYEAAQLQRLHLPRLIGSGGLRYQVKPQVAVAVAELSRLWLAFSDDSPRLLSQCLTFPLIAAYWPLGDLVATSNQAGHGHYPDNRTGLPRRAEEAQGNH
jgi:hypothetical protein